MEENFVKNLRKY